VARDLGGVALRSHALTEMLPAEVARAHLAGELHVHGLESPAGLFAACFTAEQVKSGAVPGGGTRGVGEAAASSRRLAAAMGRAVRFVDGAVTGGLALAAVPVSFAPLLLEAPREQLAEDAWHLLHATASDRGGRRVELDLTPDVPDGVADRAARDGAGDALELANGELSELSTAFAAELLRAYARAGGLPPRDTLPVPCLTVSERTLAGASLEVLRQGAEAALRGERVVFSLVRDGGVPGGTSGARPADVAHDRGFPVGCCAGRVTLNLPRAALRAGRGNLEGFLKLCERLVDLAAQGHRARRELLAQVAGRPGGALAPVFRRTRSRTPLYDLSRASWSFGVTGLNEALLLLTGFEMHEDRDETARAARRVLEFLQVKVRAAGAAADFPATLDADEDPAVARRLREMDRQREPDRTDLPGRSCAGYTTGVAVRGDAPVDPLLRIEHEEPLHRCLTTATLRVPVAADASGGPEGLLALLRKLLRAGDAVQVEFVLW
jgi:ribonucleoside-triphosphate reductase